MTDRQQEMLINRALLEFLADHPELSMNDICKCSLVTKIAGSLPLLTFSHYVVFIKLMNGDSFIYIPKERFKVKEENKNA